MELITNNSAHGLGNALREVLDTASRLSVIASYFTIFGYGKLKMKLSNLQDFRFIFDEPTFLKKMGQEKEPKEFTLSQSARENGVGGMGLELTLRNALTQQALADECAEWIRHHAQFKSVKKSGMLQTGSMFLVDNTEDSNSRTSAHGFIGQNIGLTLEGLGYEHRPNIIAPIMHLDDETSVLPQIKLFDELWNDPALLQDVTNDVLKQVETLYKENSPEFVYFLTLYHMFRNKLEEGSDSEAEHASTIEKSVIWNRLYDFQKDAVVGAIHKLEKHNGCIIADSVGLGKTYGALAVIKYYQEKRQRILVLSPKRLRENWTVYLGNDENNELADDQFNYDVLNHTDLSRHSGKTGDINLETLRWGDYDLVVIDESHNFRNRPTDTEEYAKAHSRYMRLMDDVLKAGRRTKVLMLSATPVNNRLLDLRNQLYLITEDDDAYLAAEGIPSINNVTRMAQQRFAEWSKRPEEERTTQTFVEDLNSDYFQLLDIFTIARGRKHIAKYYTSQGGDKFPERRKPISLKPQIDTDNEMPSMEELNDRIAQLRFPQYQLLQYLLPNREAKYQRQFGESWGTNMQAQQNRTAAIAGLMRVNLLKRLESSVHSFSLSLERILKNAEDLLAKIDSLHSGSAELTYENQDVQEELSENDEEETSFEIGAVDLRDVDPLKIRPELEADIDMLQELFDYANAVTPARDGKLKELKKQITEKIETTPYNDGNRKILIFSAFADTARYLYTELADELKQTYGIESALITGADGTTSTLNLRKTTFENVLSHFSPRSKELSRKDPVQQEIDIVFATDCISEGQNLQDCDCLINYDIHWNPVRIIQRFGRIDRLGSTNTQIQLINFWPQIDLDEYIQLEGRVRNRMTMLDVSASGDENILEGKRNGEMNDLLYRKQQLQQLQHEVLDLEDMSGSISITDFALDDFRVELSRYMQQHAAQLESSPIGIHAVAHIPEHLRGDVEPGVLFCLKYNGAQQPTTDNPSFPYYLLLINEQGEVKTAPAYPKTALDYMRGVCAEEHEPIERLYKQFNRETRNGRNMTAYAHMLESAVKALNGASDQSFMASLFSLNEVSIDTQFRGFDDYSLITFVVLK